MSLSKRLVHYFLPHPSNNHRAKFLHPSPIVCMAGLFAAFQILLSQPHIGPAVLGFASDITIDNIIRFTNEKRSKEGLNQLKTDPLLTQAAHEKAKDMFAKDYWAHVSPTGTEPWFFVTQAHYNYLLAGENLARDFSHSEDVVEAWMNSPTHRENLLNPKYQDIGVAVENGVLGGVQTTLVVQIFGTKLAKTQEASNFKTSKTPIVPLDSKPSQHTIPQLGFNITQQSSPRIIINPLLLNRGFASFVLILLVTLLIVDSLFIWRKQIVRLSSDNTAHLAFLIVIIVAVWVIRTGFIL